MGVASIPTILPCHAVQLCSVFWALLGCPGPSPVPPSISVFSVPPLVSCRVLSVGLSDHLSLSLRLLTSAPSPQPGPSRTSCSGPRGRAGSLLTPPPDRQDWSDVPPSTQQRPGFLWPLSPSPQEVQDLEMDQGHAWRQEGADSGAGVVYLQESLVGPSAHSRGAQECLPGSPWHGGGWWGSDKTQIPPDRGTAPPHAEDD